jgi:Domain of unknown function (DUF317)
VLRSTVPQISPDGSRRAQSMPADEPFHLGELSIAWPARTQVCARGRPDSPTVRWFAYFTPEVPGEATTDCVLALDACHRPATGHGAPEVVLDAVTVNRPTTAVRSSPPYRRRCSGRWAAGCRPAPVASVVSGALPTSKAE